MCCIVFYQLSPPNEVVNWDCHTLPPCTGLLSGAKRGDKCSLSSGLCLFLLIPLVGKLEIDFAIVCILEKIRKVV